MKNYVVAARERVTGVKTATESDYIHQDRGEALRLLRLASAVIAELVEGGECAITLTFSGNAPHFDALRGRCQNHNKTTGADQSVCSDAEGIDLMAKIDEYLKGEPNG